MSAARTAVDAIDSALDIILGLYAQVPEPPALLSEPPLGAFGMLPNEDALWLRPPVDLRERGVLCKTGDSVREQPVLAWTLGLVKKVCECKVAPKVPSWQPTA